MRCFPRLSLALETASKMYVECKHKSNVMSKSKSVNETQKCQTDKHFCQKFAACGQFRKFSEGANHINCVFFQLDFMLDLQITHVINPCEQEIRFDPTKFAKQGICYKGFICKVY